MGRNFLKLQILHARRRHLLRQKRLGRSGWSEAELQQLRERIDELQLAELGLNFWRHQLLFQLKIRMVEQLAAGLRGLGQE